MEYLIRQIKSKLEDLNELKCTMDKEDFNPQDYSGGNFDDAWYNGVLDGRIQLAKEIMELIDNE